jgi:hypothetical protein
VALTILAPPIDACCTVSDNLPKAIDALSPAIAPEADAITSLCISIDTSLSGIAHLSSGIDNSITCIDTLLTVSDNLLSGFAQKLNTFDKIGNRAVPPDLSKPSVSAITALCN